MGKGAVTRQAILAHAEGVARATGLEGLTIGRLAEDLRLSKSGLFAHFRSKEGLQKGVLDAAAAHFTDVVIRPALAERRGRTRLRALFDRWLEWSKADRNSGGCIFVAAAVELDDKPGPVRDHLVEIQRSWLECIARVVDGAVTAGEFRPDTDAAQMAHDLYGVMLSYHHAARLLKDPEAERRARRAFANLERAALIADPSSQESD
jgi:AcrR family transcriptional regulator